MRFEGDRRQNKTDASEAALRVLLDYLLGHPA
jgi:hypothetical protein